MTHITDFDKAKLYEQALQRYLNNVSKVKDKSMGFQNSLINTTEQAEKTAPREKTEDQNIQEHKKLDSSMINSLPKTLRDKGKLLLEHLKDRTKLRWNDIGEIFVDDKKISKSHIFDLMNETLRSRKNSDVPRGWDTFAKELARTNIPLELIGNKDRYRQSLGGHSFEVEPVSSFTSPERDARDSSKKVKKRRKTLEKKQTPKNTPKRLNWKSYDSV